MNALGFGRRRKDIRAVVQALRDHGIAITGPYRRRNGTFMYSLKDCVVTEYELLDLANSGKLDPVGVSELIVKVGSTRK